jgi:ubiquinone biosynthesis protein
MRRWPWLGPVRAFWRLQAIVTTLFANGFGWFVRAMRLGVCVSLRCRTVCALTHRQCHHHLAVGDSAPERVGAMLEHLGPTFVKLGQLASLRPDFVPRPYAEALRRLQDRTEPMTPDDLERVVLEEAGARPAERFADFDPEPVASASLSQVHRARLADGSDVAVKVQRPGVAELVARDLELIELMAARLERYSEQARRFRPRRAAAEFAAYTRRELDFEAEARTMEQVRANMAAEEGVVVPAVHWELTSRRLLVMDFVEGVRVDDREGIARARIDTRRAAERAARAMLRQVFDDGLFHADPHPGNVLLLPGDGVAFLDFGMFGRVDAWLRRRIAVAFLALTRDRSAEAADQLLRAAVLMPGADVEDYRLPSPVSWTAGGEARRR